MTISTESITNWKPVDCPAINPSIAGLRETFKNLGCAVSEFIGHEKNEWFYMVKTTFNKTEYRVVFPITKPQYELPLSPAR